MGVHPLIKFICFAWIFGCFGTSVVYYYQQNKCWSFWSTHLLYCAFGAIFCMFLLIFQCLFESASCSQEVERYERLSEEPQRSVIEKPVLVEPIMANVFANKGFTETSSSSDEDSSFHPQSTCDEDSTNSDYPKNEHHLQQQQQQPEWSSNEPTGRVITEVVDTVDSHKKDELCTAHRDPQVVPTYVYVLAFFGLAFFGHMICTRRFPSGSASETVRSECSTPRTK